VSHGYYSALGHASFGTGQETTLSRQQDVVYGGSTEPKPQYAVGHDPAFTHTVPYHETHTYWLSQGSTGRSPPEPYPARHDPPMIQPQTYEYVTLEQPASKEHSPDDPHPLFSEWITKGWEIVSVHAMEHREQVGIVGALHHVVVGVLRRLK
jgi:hypothetical protein